MMPLNPIIVAAVADVLAGVVIYSDYAFGPLWHKVTGMKCKMGKDAYLRFALQFVCSLMTATALYIAILTFQKTDVTYVQSTLTNMYAWFFTPTTHTDFMSAVKIAGFLWLGFYVPFIFSHIIWDTTINWQKGALKSVFKLIHLAVMTAVLVYLG
ncbi:DUF1761 domain-containing protein [Candidatus Babeliales bacterium]|nr:DUF1761 domain-containing protein [Candidatus Babeliales bacterium]